MSIWPAVVLPIFLMSALRFFQSASLSILISAIQSHSTLRTSTTKFGVVEQVVIIWLLLVKYTANLFGFIRPPKIRDGGKMELPEMDISSTLTITQTEIDLMTSAVSSASHAGANASDGAMLLSALTTPYLLLLFSKIQCPVFPIGSVNTTNKFEYTALFHTHSSNLIGKPLNVLARIGGDAVLAKRVKRGMELDAIIEVSLPSADGTAGGLLFRQTISILQFMSRSAKPTPAPTSDTKAESEVKVFEKGAVVVEKADPWKWAAVCGDYNPIHISPILAKSFGFPNQLAHGNHIIALVNVFLGYRVTEAETVVVRFLRPCVLPAKVDVRESADGTRVEIFKGEKIVTTIDRMKGIDL